MYGPKSPRKWRSSAAYAVPASSGDASTAARIERAAIAVPGTVTSLHDLPWLRDIWITPLVAPVQMTPGVTVDAATDHRARCGMVVSRAGSCTPVTVGTLGCGIERSGLSLDQVAPPSTVPIRYW